MLYRTLLYSVKNQRFIKKNILIYYKMSIKPNYVYRGNPASQIVRYAPRDTSGRDYINPGKIALDIKPSRWYFEDVNPNQQDGTVYDLWVNVITDDVFQKNNNGLWEVKFNYSTGGTGGLSNCSNVGVGVGMFQGLTGSTADFRSLSSNDGKVSIQVSGDNDEVELGVQNLTPNDVGLNFVNNINNPVDKPSLSSLNALGSIAGIQRGCLGTITGGSLYICNQVLGPASSQWSILATSNDTFNKPAFCNLVADIDFGSPPVSDIPINTGPTTFTILENGPITFYSSQRRSDPTTFDFTQFKPPAGTYIESNQLSRTSQYNVIITGQLERSVPANGLIEYEICMIEASNPTPEFIVEGSICPIRFDPNTQRVNYNTSFICTLQANFTNQYFLAIRSRRNLTPASKVLTYQQSITFQEIL
jgi:hypothetical protein